MGLDKVYKDLRLMFKLQVIYNHIKIVIKKKTVPGKKENVLEYTE
jgi:hypothetical protein